jgi:hypothetical protein
LRLAYCSVVLLTALGCSSPGELVHVTVSDATLPANLKKAAVTVAIDGKTELRNFPVNGAPTTLDFGVGVPSKYVGSMVSVTVQLEDGNGAAIGSGMGTGTIAKGITELTVTIGGGGGDTLCANVVAPALCDGFETGPASFWNAPLSSGGTSATTTDTAHAFRGTHSLHVVTDAFTAMDGGASVVYATLNETSFLPTSLYLREYLYVPSGFPGEPGGIANYEQHALPFQQIVLDLDSQSFTVFDSIDQTSQHATGEVIPYDQWFCVEWSAIEGTKGATTVKVNDKLLTGLSAPVNTMASPPFDELAIGLISSVANTPKRELWIDEVIIDSSPIGCAK